jgi:hypothetical protein
VGGQISSAKLKQQVAFTTASMLVKPDATTLHWLIAREVLHPPPEKKSKESGGPTSIQQMEQKMAFITATVIGKPGRCFVFDLARVFDKKPADIIRDVLRSFVSRTPVLRKTTSSWVSGRTNNMSTIPSDMSSCYIALTIGESQFPNGANLEAITSV